MKKLVIATLAIVIVFSVFFLPSIVFAQQDPIFFADFNTCLNGDDGSCEGFTPITGNWNVQNKEYIINTASPTEISLVDNLSCNNCTIQTSIREEICFGSFLGILTRYQDFSNYYGFIIDIQGKRAWFLKSIQGVKTLNSQIIYPFNCNKTYNLTLKGDGNNFTAFIDNNLVLSINANELNNGKFGLYSSNTGGNYPGYFDNVIIYGQGFSPVEICNDGIDNDGDNLIDCNDIIDCGGYCIAQLQTQNQQLQQQVNQNKGFINTLIKKVNEIMCYLKLGPCIASNTIEEKTA